MILPRPFLMIRHGQSEANLAELCSGHMDVALTALGRDQARTAGKIIAGLPEALRPRRIVHSHLQRARDTAALINESLGGLPISETPDIAEQYFGKWEGMPWQDAFPRLKNKEDPEGGETHLIFRERAKKAVQEIVGASEDMPLIVSHGGVFHAFTALYDQEIGPVMNCAPYRFSPRDHAYSWEIAAITASA